MITPTDPEGSAGDAPEGMPSDQRYFQLTHDYLVHSLREWLSRKQRETRRGRAELILAERAAIWSTKPEIRHLPALAEWARIRALTRSKDWSDPQREMMRRGGRVHGLRALASSVFFVILGWVAVEEYGRLQASALVTSLKTANITDVPGIVQRITPYRRWADAQLRTAVDGASGSVREKLHSSLALLPVDPSQVPYLETQLQSATADELPILCEMLFRHRQTLVPGLWAVVVAAAADDTRLLPCAGALARYDPESSQWTALSRKVAESLVTVNPVFLGAWLRAVGPVRQRLTAPLAEIFRQGTRLESEHNLATSILADFAHDEPALLAGLVMDADPKAYRALFRVAEEQADQTLPLFEAELAGARIGCENKSPAGDKNDDRRMRQARAAVALVRLHHGEGVWSQLAHSPDPGLRSFIINWLKPLGADFASVVAEFDQTNKSVQPTEAKPLEVLFDPEISKRRALIQILGTFAAEHLPTAERERLTTTLFDLYRNDCDAGIHSAAEWTLRRWKAPTEKLQAIDSELKRLKELGKRRWRVNSQGQSFALVSGPLEFVAGAPENEPDRTPGDEPPTLTSIGAASRFRPRRLRSRSSCGSSAITRATRCPGNIWNS